MLRHDLDHDLNINREDIIDILRDEIAGRYYSDADRVFLTLPGDSAYIRAAAIIADPAEYRRLLSPAK